MSERNFSLQPPLRIVSAGEFHQRSTTVCSCLVTLAQVTGVNLRMASYTTRTSSRTILFRDHAKSLPHSFPHAHKLGPTSIPSLSVPGKSPVRQKQVSISSLFLLLVYSGNSVTRFPTNLVPLYSSPFSLLHSRLRTSLHTLARRCRLLTRAWIFRTNLFSR